MIDFLLDELPNHSLDVCLNYYAIHWLFSLIIITYHTYSVHKSNNKLNSCAAALISQSTVDLVVTV